MSDGYIPCFDIMITSQMLAIGRHEIYVPNGLFVSCHINRIMYIIPYPMHTYYFDPFTWTTLYHRDICRYWWYISRSVFLQLTYMMYILHKHVSLYMLIYSTESVKSQITKKWCRQSTQIDDKWLIIYFIIILKHSNLEEMYIAVYI